MKISFGGSSPFITSYHIGISINPVDGISDLQQALLLETSGSAWHFIEQELTGNWLYGLWLGDGGRDPVWKTKTYVLAEKELSLKCPADTTVYVATGQTSAVVNGIAPVVLPSNPGVTISYYTSGATNIYGYGDASGQRFNVGATNLEYYASLTGYEIYCKTQISVVPLSTTRYYLDLDGDGFGDPAKYMDSPSPTPPPGYVNNADDCDDGNAAIHPNTIWYKDTDNDGYSNGVTLTQCAQPAGYKLAANLTATTGDCNDGNGAVNPGATEVCGNGIDDNCNGSTDEGCGVLLAWYRDKDGDGFGNAAVVVYAATPPNKQYVAISGDCNDNNNTVYPGAPELPDGRDNNCNGEIDEGLDCRKVWYRDSDGDGYGRNALTKWSCVQPNGYVLLPGDCNDHNPDRHPGAPEICDGKDNDCDGIKDEDCIMLTSKEVDNNLHPMSKEPTGELAVRLWPNPAKTEFIVALTGLKGNEKVELVLMNSTGLPVQSKRIDPLLGQQVRFGVSALPTGIYFVSVKQGQLLLTQKIAIIR
jgi:hypothetical protein